MALTINEKGQRVIALTVDQSKTLQSNYMKNIPKIQDLAPKVEDLQNIGQPTNAQLIAQADTNLPSENNNLSEIPGNFLGNANNLFTESNDKNGNDIVETAPVNNTEGIYITIAELEQIQNDFDSMFQGMIERVKAMTNSKSSSTKSVDPLNNAQMPVDSDTNNIDEIENMFNPTMGNVNIFDQPSQNEQFIKVA